MSLLKFNSVSLHVLRSLLPKLTAFGKPIPHYRQHAWQK